MAGRTYEAALGRSTDMYVVKTDSSGSAEWTDNLGSDGDDEGYAGLETTDGHYVIAGGTPGVGGVGMELDSSRSVSWQRALESDAFRALAQNYDLGFALAGSAKGTCTWWRSTRAATSAR